MLETKKEAWESEDGLLLLRSWVRDGLTYPAIAARIGVDTRTLKNWRASSEPIRKAMNTGKEIVDYAVENALLKSALGYRTQEVKVILGHRARGQNMVELSKEIITKDVGPNPNACIAWLTNRCPEKWKRNPDRFEREEDRNFTITIERGPGVGGEELNQRVTVSPDEVRYDTEEKDEWEQAVEDYL